MSQPVPAAAIRTQVSLPLRFPDGFVAPSRVITFHGLVDGREHLALGFGAWAVPDARRLRIAGLPLVRPHSECLTGDVFGSQRCDCGAQLREAVERLSAVGGYLLYLRQEGRGIGLYAKVDAYELQDAGLDTYEANLALGHGADERDYTVAAQMLRALGVRYLRLLSNNPDKAAQLQRLGISIVGQEPTAVHLSTDNVRYLAAKAGRGAHTIDTAAIDTAAIGSSPTTG
jgi:GTP cyclohydrolase II